MAIAIATLTPAEHMLEAPGSDKLHHILAFAALTLPLSWLRWQAGWWLIPAAALFGGLIEIIQPHVGRHGDWADALANAVGALCGWALGASLSRFWRPDGGS